MRLLQPSLAPRDHWIPAASGVSRSKVSKTAMGVLLPRTLRSTTKGETLCDKEPKMGRVYMGGSKGRR